MKFFIWDDRDKFSVCFYEVAIIRKEASGSWAAVVGIEDTIRNAYIFHENNIDEGVDVINTVLLLPLKCCE